MLDRQSRRIGIVAVLFSFAITACGGTSKPSSSPNATTTTIDHQEKLAEGETAGIASQLTGVPGYRYVDPSPSEVEHEVEGLKQQLAKRGAPADLLRAVSFHSVVAEDPAQNTARTGEGEKETGFLQLREFSPPPPSDADVTQMGTDGMQELGSFTVAGTKAVVYDDPTATPNSRYVVIWMRHGVWSAFDGASRAPIEKWTRAYLGIPERQPNENDQLANALVKVPGTAYANFWDDSTAAVAKELFDGAPASSIHSVVNTEGSLGTLMLGTAGAGVTQQSIDAVIAQRVGPSTPATMGGLAVHKAESPSGDAYTWISGGVAHVLLSRYPAQAEAFLRQYLTQ